MRQMRRVPSFLVLIAVAMSVLLPGRTAAGAEVAVGAAGTPTGTGYWTVTPSGKVMAVLAAVHRGDMDGRHLDRPMVGIGSSATGNGYWLIAGDGGIFSFGDAPFLGSTGGIRLEQPVVGISPTSTGRGYWMVAADGGIFSFGDALFQGSSVGRLSNVVKIF